MLKLSLIYAPSEIFKQKAEIVNVIDDEIRQLIKGMLKIMYTEKAVGVGANMVGVLKRVAVVDLQDGGIRSPYIFINPEITKYSEETQTFKESSICFPGIDADITRSKEINIKYLDEKGNQKELNAQGFLATVIQHEVDYLDGKIFLSYLSKLKRDTLLKKMQKYIKMNPPHIHSENCRH